MGVALEGVGKTGLEPKSQTAVNPKKEPVIVLLMFWFETGMKNCVCVLGAVEGEGILH